MAGASSVQEQAIKAAKEQAKDLSSPENMMKAAAAAQQVQAKLDESEPAADKE